MPALWPRFRPGRDEGRFAQGEGALAVGHDASGLRAGWRLDRYSANNELGTLLAVAAGLALLAWRSTWGRW